jgi:hypothetical protein
MKLLHTPFVLVLSVILSTSCGTKESEHAIEAEEVTAEYKDTTPVTVNDTTKFKFDFAIANIPTPASSMQELQKWNVPYDNSILNETQEGPRYTTEFKQSFNLGVYNIDMAYAMMNDKGADVLKYMKVVMVLSDALGLRNAVDAMVGKRAERNLSSKDSLFKILDEIFVKSDSYLRTNERVYLAATVFAGSWLENLYITCKVNARVMDPKMKEAGRKHLWEQRFHLGNLINLLNDYKDKKECAELIADLKTIHSEITAIKQPSEMDDAKFKSISDKIIALRQKLTS